MEVGSSICHVLRIGAPNDFKGPVVSSSSGMGMDRNGNHRGEFYSVTKLVNNFIFSFINVSYSQYQLTLVFCFWLSTFGTQMS